TLKGTITLTAGLGGMGGAQPLAVSFCEGVSINVEVDKSRIEKHIEIGYCDDMIEDLDEALKVAEKARVEGRSLSSGLLGNAAEIINKSINNDTKIDVATNQTNAHHPLNGYINKGYQ